MDDTPSDTPPDDTPPNDIPVIANADIKTIDESDFNSGIGQVEGTVNVDFGSESGTISPSGLVTIDGPLTNNQLMSGGAVVDIIATTDGYVGIINGTTPVFTLSLDPLSGQYNYEQLLPINNY